MEQDAITAEAPVAEKPDATDYLALANSAYEGSTSYLDTNYRAQWERNIRQHRSQHRQGSKYLSETWKSKSKFFRPKTRSAVRKSEAAAAAAWFSTQDVVEIDAYDDNDNMQLASAEFWKAAINYRLKFSVPWFMTVMGAYQDCQVMGAVVSHQCWDYDEDRPKPELRPLENVRIDPAADWADPINSSPYLIDMLPMYVQDVKERCKRIDGSQWILPTDGEFKAAKSSDTDSTRQVRDGQRTDAKDGTESGITDFDIVWVHRIIMRRDGQDIIYYTLSRGKLLCQPMPLKQAYPWLTKRKRPYVMGICVIEPHRVYPSSPVELAAPVMDELNELINQRRDNVSLVLNKRYHVKRNRQVDIRSLTRNVPGSVTMMDDPVNDVVAQEWNDVTGSSYNEEDRLNLDHDDLMGSFSGSSVQSNRALNETVGGMNHLASDAKLSGDYTLKTFTETWFEPAIGQILQMMQYYETDAVVLALAGNKADLVQKFGIDTVTDELLSQQLLMSVNISMGSTNPMNNIERFMLGINSLSKAFGPEKVAERLEFDAVTKELFGKLGYKDGSRFINDDDEDPRIAQLMAQIQELQAKVMQKRDPAVDKAEAKLKDAQAVKTMVEAEFGATQAAATIAGMPEVAPVADAVLQAAGYQLPNPAGVDPNLPAPAQAVVTPPMAQNTSPLEPALPASPVAGLNVGIEGGNG